MVMPNNRSAVMRGLTLENKVAVVDTIIIVKSMAPKTT
jgi:hypothetical protein